MFNKMIFLPVVVLVMYSCNRPSVITEEEVINTIKKFDYGWENKQMSMVDSVLSPAYVYYTRSGSTFSRDSVVATAGENSYSLRDMSRSEFKVTIAGNTAVVSTRWKGRGMYRGEPFNEDQRCSLVLIKKENRMEIISEHCTPIKFNKIFH